MGGARRGSGRGRRGGAATERRGRRSAGVRRRRTTRTTSSRWRTSTRTRRAGPAGGRRGLLAVVRRGAGGGASASPDRRGRRLDTPRVGSTLSAATSTSSPGVVAATRQRACWRRPARRPAARRLWRRPRSSPGAGGRPSSSSGSPSPKREVDSGPAAVAVAGPIAAPQAEPDPVTTDDVRPTRRTPRAGGHVPRAGGRRAERERGRLGRGERRDLVAGDADGERGRGTGRGRRRSGKSGTTAQASRSSRPSKSATRVRQESQRSRWARVASASARFSARRAVGGEPLAVRVAAGPRRGAQLGVEVGLAQLGWRPPGLGRGGCRRHAQPVGQPGGVAAVDDACATPRPASARRSAVKAG